MIELKDNKSLTENAAISPMPTPQRAYIPLSQHAGAICNILEVKTGDNVVCGQKIASSQAHVSALVHASITGKVIAIQNHPHHILGRCKTIIIEAPEGVNQNTGDCVIINDIKNIPVENILKAIKEAGVVGMGGAAFPTHIKLSPGKPVNAIIINGAECEPYLTADYRLMIEKTAEVIKGAQAAAKCLGAKETYIAIEDNKPGAIEKFKPYETGGLKIKTLKSAYPQGGEKQLIKNVLGKEVPAGKLPFEAGAVVLNTATAFAVYEALYKNKPLYQRVVTVTGSCIANPKNVLARIGTPIKDLIEFCGPLKEKPAKIIVGGPMMGIAQCDDMVPVIKSTTGIILLSEKESKINEENSCIRCASCVKHCPMNLMPCLINLSAQKNMLSEAKAYGAMNCIECGVCDYVCSSNRRIVESIRRVKSLIAKQI